MVNGARFFYKEPSINDVEYALTNEKPLLMVIGVAIKKILRGACCIWFVLLNYSN